jgi:hypothetical protein
VFHKMYNQGEGGCLGRRLPVVADPRGDWRREQSPVAYMVVCILWHHRRSHK